MLFGPIINSKCLEKKWTKNQRASTKFKGVSQLQSVSTFFCTVKISSAFKKISWNFNFLQGPSINYVVSVGGRGVAPKTIYQIEYWTPCTNTYAISLGAVHKLCCLGGWGGGSSPRDLTETIESGPLCITVLFQNKSVAYFKSIFIFLRIF